MAKTIYELLPGKPDFDETVYELGKLCRSRHDWCGSGMSLRLVDTGACAECQRRRLLDKSGNVNRDTRLKSLNIERLKEVLEYDPHSPSGLRWRITMGGKAKAGQVAGALGREGGFAVQVQGNTYPTAHLVLAMHGIFPASPKDVCVFNDGNKSNCRVENLKWVANGEKRKRSHGRKLQEILAAAFPGGAPPVPDGHSLGALCSRGHRWHGADVSLRRFAKCVECERQRKRSERYMQLKRAYRQRNLEQLRQKDRERFRRYLSDPVTAARKRENSRLAQAKMRATSGRQSRKPGYEHIIIPPGVNAGPAFYVLIDRGFLADDAGRLEAEYLAMWKAIKAAGRCPSVTRLVEDEQQRYFAENPEVLEEIKKERDRVKSLEQYHRRMLFDPEYRLYMRQKSKRRKALMRSQIGVQLKGRQVRQRFAEFGNCCAYCGASGDLHIEHFIPISKGGTHVLGNILPACQTCNFSKTNHEAEAWYRSQPFFSEKQWNAILKALGLSKASPSQLSLL